MKSTFASLVPELRTQFPAMARTHLGQPVAYLDGPAGTQVPQRVIQAMTRYMVECNANHGGAFPTAVESDARLDLAHAKLATFVGASDPDEVVFGANMTSLTFAFSLAVARTWSTGDEVIVTRLDHDANVTPWVLAARDAGATVRYVEVDPATCTLDMRDFQDKLSPRTRLVAVGGASNAVGTINPIRDVIQAARRHGALVFVDAVHLAAHRRLQVKQWGCDVLVCSPYKFFGPHSGVLWGRRDLLEELEAYKVRPATNALPGKWMTGTQSHEAICGAAAAVDYLASIGQTVTGQVDLELAPALDAAFEAITQYETELADRFLRGLAELPAWKNWGLGREQGAQERVSTFSITHSSLPPVDVAAKLGEMGLFAWHGNYYALQLSELLQREPDGMLRIGLLHYNTPSEVDRLLDALARLG
ncbi:MAG: cysteine desulfurase-like protein [Planctomycetales bacterium]|nr:cysteine desulfurase-like protein [Planctomycetales bacterium]